MSKPTASSLVDWVDELDHPIRAVPRGQVLSLRANFRTAHVFVFDQAGRVLLQRLAEGRERNPGLWGSSVAGYVFAGETYEQAASRRLRDEICLDGPLERVGKTAMVDQRSKKFVGLFVSQGGAARNCAPDEIDEICFREPTDVAHDLRSRPSDFTPTFRAVYRYWVEMGSPFPQ